MKILAAFLVCVTVQAADFDTQLPPQVINLSAFPTSPMIDEFIFQVSVSDMFSIDGNQLQIQEIDIVGNRVADFTSPCWVHPPKIDCWLGLPTDPEFTDVPVMINSRIVRPSSIVGHLMIPPGELGLGWVFTATVTDLDGLETNASSFFTHFVPEPSSLLAMVLGLALLPMFRRLGLQ